MPFARVQEAMSHEAVGMAPGGWLLVQPRRHPPVQTIGLRLAAGAPTMALERSVVPGSPVGERLAIRAGEPVGARREIEFEVLCEMVTGAERLATPEVQRHRATRWRYRRHGPECRLVRHVIRVRFPSAHECVRIGGNGLDEAGHQYRPLARDPRGRSRCERGRSRSTHASDGRRKADHETTQPPAPDQARVSCHPTVPRGHAPLPSPATRVQANISHPSTRHKPAVANPPRWPAPAIVDTRAYSDGCKREHPRAVQARSGRPAAAARCGSCGIDGDPCRFPNGLRWTRVSSGRWDSRCRC